MSTLRLRFGEPVRFRFLVGMLSSTGNQKELLTAGIKFLNTFLNTAGSNQKRLYLQAELEQAGFDIVSIRKVSIQVLLKYIIVAESILFLARIEYSSKSRIAVFCVLRK